MAYESISQTAASPAITRVDMRPGLARTVVQRMVEEAAGMLEAPRCQLVFSDFRDREGRRLDAVLKARGKTPAEFLASLWFVDATDERQCLSAAAFTSPGSLVVFVCASQFADRSLALNGRRGKIVIIHEMLHSLGLGENPPTSAQITSQVAKRCDQPKTDGKAARVTIARHAARPHARARQGR